MVLTTAGSASIWLTLAETDLAHERVLVSALVRQRKQPLAPPSDTRMQAVDARVLFGALCSLDRMTARLPGLARPSDRPRCP